MEHTPIRHRDQLPDWCNAGILAGYLGISKSSMYRLAKSPGCPKWQEKPGATLLFPRDKWLAWFEAQINTTQ